MPEFNQSTHPGNMPIRVLKENMLGRFENAIGITREEHLHNIEIEKISAGIQYDIEKQPSMSPYVQSSTIFLQECFLSYLWAMLYSLIIIYDETIVKKLRNGNWNGKVLLEEPLTERAYQLFNWALSLKRAYSEWPIDLPNPEYMQDEEREFVLKINNIYLDVTTLVLVHEYAHLVEDYAGDKKGERMADNFARNALLDEQPGNKKQFGRNIAAIILWLALMFINKPDFHSKTHPDLEIRLLDALQSLKYDKKEDEASAMYLASFCILKYSEINSIPLPAAFNATQYSYHDFLNECVNLLRRSS